MTKRLIVWAILLGFQNHSIGANAGKLQELQELLPIIRASRPEPVDVSATLPYKSGERTIRAASDPFSFYDFKYAQAGALRSLIPEIRQPQPDLLACWVLWTDDKFLGDIKNALSPSLLAQWGAPLTDASSALIQARRTRDDLYGESRRAAEASLDLEGRRKALAGVVNQLLSSMGTLDPSTNANWSAIMDVLMTRLNQEAPMDAYYSQQKIQGSLDQAFFGATPHPPEVDAEIQKTQAKYLALQDQQMPVLIEGLLGQMPMTYLRQNSGFIAAEKAFDAQLFEFLNLPTVKADPDTIRLLDGVYPLWSSLVRYRDYLKTDETAYKLHLLAQVAAVCQAGENWNPSSLDPDTGAGTSEYVAQRAGRTIDIIYEYLTAWVNGRSPQPLYAAVSVDRLDHPAPAKYGWVVWKWVTSDDLDDLKAEDRVGEGLGRKWLLPVGHSNTAINSIQDAGTAKAREILLVLDANMLEASK